MRRTETLTIGELEQRRLNCISRAHPAAGEDAVRPNDQALLKPGILLRFPLTEHSATLARKMSLAIIEANLEKATP